MSAPPDAVTLAEQLLDLGVEDALTMDGYDDCVIGILERFGMEPIVLYDKERVLQKFMDDGAFTYEDAIDFYSYNQLGSWLGELTPGFVVRLEADAWERPSNTSLTTTTTQEKPE